MRLLSSLHVFLHTKTFSKSEHNNSLTADLVRTLIAIVKINTVEYTLKSRNQLYTYLLVMTYQIDRRKQMLTMNSHCTFIVKCYGLRLL